MGYDAPNRWLYVTFRDATYYVYFEVTEADFQGLISARSHGRYFDLHIRYFDLHIRPHYRYRRLSSRPLSVPKPAARRIKSTPRAPARLYSVVPLLSDAVADEHLMGTSTDLRR